MKNKVVAIASILVALGLAIAPIARSTMAQSTPAASSPSTSAVHLPPDRAVGQWIQQTRDRERLSRERLAQNYLDATVASSAATDNSRAAAARSAPNIASRYAASRYAGRGRGPWRYGSFPVENFQSYTSPFGYRRAPYGRGRRQFHRGLDLAAPKGSYIRNWWTGRVVKVTSGDSCGTAIWIQSGRWQHVYCHMIGRVEVVRGRRYLSDRPGGIFIAVGQTLPAGARIGRVGMTGRTTGPHLHWGIRYDGNLIDPALVLRAMYAARS